MSNASKIRAFMEAAGRPMTCAEVREGTGLPKPRVASCIGDMVRAGHVTAFGEKGSQTYALSGKPVKVWRFDPENRKELRRQSQRNYRRRIGVRPREEIAAEAKERKRLRELAQSIRADNARRRQEAVRDKPAKVAKTEHAARDRRDAVRQVVAMRTSALAAPPVAEDRPCTESFIREFGNDPAKYQVLKPGQWSAPLRFEY